MVTYRHPGVFIEEVGFKAQAQQGVSMAVTGFMGLAKRGKPGEPTLVTSWPDYRRKFAHGLESAFQEDAYLPYSLFGYFDNGGSLAYVIRITDGDEETSTITLDDGETEATDVVKIDALDPGDWGNNIEVEFIYGKTTRQYIKDGVTKGSSATDGWSMIVYYNDTVIEVYDDISFVSTDDNFLEEETQNSRYIETEVLSTEELDSDVEGTKQSLTGGTDGGAPDKDDFSNALENWDEVEELGQLVIPDMQHEDTIEAALEYCENERGDLFLLADGAEDADIAAIQLFRDNFDSDYGSLYYPWIEIRDPLGGTKFVPVGGHQAGATARTDKNRGVYKAPAGIAVKIIGALNTKIEITDDIQADLNPGDINCVRAKTNSGIVTWGARTLAGGYVNQRRGLNYIKRYLKLNTKWVVFEPHTEELWNDISTFIEDFLIGEANKGGFKGTTPEQQYFIVCDDSINNTNSNEIYAEIGVAIAEPGEFFVIRVGQWDSGSSAIEL